MSAPSSCWFRVLISTVGGLLTSTAFPDLNFWPAAIAALAALLWATAGTSVRCSALAGFSFGFAYLAPVLWWAYASVGVIPWVALSALQAGFVALFAAAWAWLRGWRAVRRHPGWYDPALAAVAWVAMEELRSRWPFGGLPWGRLAFSQTDGPLLALAAWGGAPLVSGMVVLISGYIVLLLTRWRAGEYRRATAAAVVVAASLTGPFLIALTKPEPSTSAATLRVGLVQGNVPGDGLEAFGRMWQVLNNHADGTYALLEQVEPGELDLVVWPENGTDVDPQANAQAAAIIAAAAQTVDAPMLVGTVEYPASGGRYNTAVLWEPGTGVVAEYSKQHPAPFAEYIPWRPFVRLFSPAVDLVTRDMIAGTQPGIMTLDTAQGQVKLGTVICFEVAYDELVRSSVTGGAELIVVQTNNASFGDTAESTQQLAMTRFRAVEHGRTALQVSTVGVSGVIFPDGTITERTELFTADQIVADVPLATSQTLATRLGSLPTWITVILVGVAVAGRSAQAVAQRRAKRRAGGLPE